MRIQVFSEYYNLAQAGKLKFPACPHHEEYKPAIFDLIHKLENDGQISLNCLACGYKMFPGIAFYHKILKEIESAKNESKKSGGSL